MAQVNHKQNIFTKTYHFRGRLWSKSYRTIVAGTQQIDGTWKHLRKWRPMSMLHKKNQQVYKKRYTCSYSWTWRRNAALLQSLASALRQALSYWSVEKRKILDECVGLIWFGRLKIMDFQFFLTLEEQNRVTAQAKRKFSLLSHTLANRNERPCCKHFLTTPAYTSICLLASKIRISNSSPLQGRRVNRLPCFCPSIIGESSLDFFPWVEKAAKTKVHRRGTQQSLHSDRVGSCQRQVSW